MRELRTSRVESAQGLGHLQVSCDQWCWMACSVAASPFFGFELRIHTCKAAYGLAN